ncbi:hypothetical protein N7501_001033 [Penicillium viridicatum]|nr:hypothetical protein N7501_001033 [Penicillium viridicatum]
MRIYRGTRPKFICKAERQATKHGEQNFMQKQVENLRRELAELTVKLEAMEERGRQQARAGSARMGVQSPRGPSSSGLRHSGGLHQSPARGRGEHPHIS